MQKQYESDVVECGANGPDDQFISRPQWHLQFSSVPEIPMHSPPEFSNASFLII